jgi:dTDP-4-dehydrorhamnose 3,5-epimerase
MEFEELDLQGVWLATSPTYQDSRGLFREWFKSSDFEKASGIIFITSQSNCSTSVENVIRGIHFSRSPIGQAKMVTCVQGSILDVVVDLRKSSETFMQSLQVELNSVNGSSVYIPSGFGHGFISLGETNTVVYNLTSEYDPENEFTIDAFDPMLNIAWPNKSVLRSERDLAAVGIQEMFLQLPD